VITFWISTAVTWWYWETEEGKIKTTTQQTRFVKKRTPENLAEKKSSNFYAAAALQSTFVNNEDLTKIFYHISRKSFPPHFEFCGQHIKETVYMRREIFFLELQPMLVDEQILYLDFFDETWPNLAFFGSTQRDFNNFRGYMWTCWDGYYLKGVKLIWTKTMYFFLHNSNRPIKMHSAYSMNMQIEI
jgi:hypothetical protein